MNSCSVKLFEDFKSASEYANDEIDSYGSDYQGNVTERASHHLQMEAGDIYVTIDIEEHELCKSM